MSNKLVSTRVDGIYQWPSAILENVSKRVEFPLMPGTKEWRVIEDMKMWEDRHPKSQGLSAIQMGVSKRIAVVRINGKMKTLINPKLVFKFGQQLSNEGCHSLNENRFTLYRSLCGVVEYCDELGKRRYMYLNKKYIRLIQHELDHMNGILINKEGTPYEDTGAGNTA